MEQNMNFDNEVLAYLSTRKDELMQQHDEYIADHPEIREVLNDFLSSVLLSKPVSPYCNQLTQKTQKRLMSVYRTMFSFSRRSTSTHSTQLL